MLAGHTGRGGMGAAGGLAGGAGQRRALTAREKAALSVTAYDAADPRFAAQEECCICLSAFEPADPVRVLPTCPHVFHAACLDNWFDVASTCPLCKADVKTATAAALASSARASEGGGGARGRARRAWQYARRRVFLWPPMRDGRGQTRAHDGDGGNGVLEEEGAVGGHGGDGGPVLMLQRMAVSLTLPVGIWGRWPLPLPGAPGEGRPPAAGREGEPERELEVVFLDGAEGNGTLTAASSFASQPPEAEEPGARAAAVDDGADADGECCDDEGEDEEPPGADGGGRGGGGFMSSLPSLLVWQARPSSSVAAGEEDAEAGESKVEADAGLGR